MRRVVITGMGIVSSIGDNVSQVLQSLWETRSGITFSQEMADAGFRSQVYGKPKLDPSMLVERRALRFMGQGSAWNYVAMLQAIDSAGLTLEEISHPRIGLIMGSGGPSTSAIVRASDIMREQKSTRRIGPSEVPKAMSSTASATLATPFRIKGLNHSITAACATSAICIGSAYQQIKWEEQDMIFAGGSEELDVTLSCLFDAMGAMATRFNDIPASASRAYDVNRDGFVIAGGAGVLVLEALDHALARDATILAEIVGYGHTSDGDDMVAPSGEGAVRCMQLALGALPPDAIDYINPHGTATPKGDAAEIRAIKGVFGATIPEISSTKSLTGHSLGAAGVQEAIYSILAMQHRFIPASANIESLDEAFEGVPIARQRMDDVPIEYVLSNSFGFGGTNATLIFKRYRN